MNATILIFIFLSALILRLMLVFNSAGYNDDSSYFVMRQVETIMHDPKPMYYDELSYGGRETISSPGYYYIMALLDIILPDLVVYRIIPQLFALSLIIIIYFFTKELTKNNNIALFNSFVAAFVPVYFVETFNSISIYTFVIPLIFLTLYAFAMIDKGEKYIYIYLACFFLLCFSHPSAILVVLTLFIYLLFLKTEGMKLNNAEFELILFSIFFAIWSQFIIYKKALLFHGTEIIWHNMPNVLMSQHFVQFNVVSVLSLIGIIPFICGIYMIYKYAFKIKSQQAYLLISFALLLLLLVWLRLIEYKEGLMLLSMTLVIFFGLFMKGLINYGEKTKIDYLTKYVWIIFFILIFVTAIVPCIIFAREASKDAFSDEEMKAYSWLKDNTRNDSVVLASLSEGHLITQVAERKNVIDSNFLLVKNINERFDDVNEIYNAIYKTQAIGILDKYDVNYIFMSHRTRGVFDIEELKFIDEECFDLKYNESVMIYEIKCRLKTDVKQ